MANKKVTGLTENTDPQAADLLHVVDDPGGTPDNQKLQVSNLIPTYSLLASETSAGITSVEGKYDYTDIRRFGIVPDDTSARTANTTALQELLDPTTTGPQGWFFFINETGTSTYYFDDIITIRDGCHLDLCGCTLDFLKTSYTSADDYTGFLYAIRDVTIQNGIIDVDYDGTGGVNPGNVLQFGNRSDAGDHFPGDDEDFTYPMGHITARNLRLTSNNPVGRGILMFGGLTNCTFENIFIDGQDALFDGIYYEFGFAHSDVVIANRQTSHAKNMNFKNIYVKDLDTSLSAPTGLSLIGAYNCVVDGLYVNTAKSVFTFRPGEALFYNPWVGEDEAGAKRSITLRNLVGQGITSIGITLTGAESASSGYLSGEGLTESEQTDLMRFSLDGFSIDGASVGLSISGPCDVRNGSIRNSTAEGLRLTDECVDFHFDRVEIIDGSTAGVRANFGSPIFATERKKVGTFSNCFIAGNANNGIDIDHTESVQFNNCRIGYTTNHDGADETTQNIGINAQSDSDGIVANGCTIKTSGGSNAYNAGGAPRGHNIINPKGDITVAGVWGRMGLEPYTASNIADSGHTVNVDDKYLYRQVYDTSNDRAMVAQGSGTTDNWISIDGVTTVTPS